MNDLGRRGHGTNEMLHQLSRASLLAAVLFAAAPARADEPPAPPPIHALVSGGPVGSADLVARAIAAELGRPVDLIGDTGACPAPCAAIAIDTEHGAATVRVTSDAGELRQRTISIPGDPAGAAEVIALLVGNMAREEASVVIGELAAVGAGTGDGEAEAVGAGEAGEATAPVVGGLEDPFAESGEGHPADPFAGPVAVGVGAGVSGGVRVVVAGTPRADVVAVEPEREGRTSLSIGLVPPLSIRFGGASRRGLSIQALVGYSDEAHLLSIGGVVDYVGGDVYGAQIAGAVGIAGRIRGLQIAGAVAEADQVDGLQIAGAVATSGGGAGLQIAGAVSNASGRAGTQIAGAVTTAGGGAGVQIAGAVNHAGGSVGTQIAGAVNIAGGSVYGAQIGTVNVAGTVHGLQLGLVNIASKTNGGLSLGLINIVPGGRSEIEATVDTQQVGAVLFRHGSGRWHNVYGVAGRATGGLLDDTLNDDDVFMYGFGFGPTFKLGVVTLDIDAVGWHVLYGDGTHGHADVLAQLRIVGAFPVGGVELIGGVAANVYITTDPARGDFAEKRIEPEPGMMDTGARVMVTPTAFVGVRL